MITITEENLRKSLAMFKFYIPGEEKVKEEIIDLAVDVIKLWGYTNEKEDCCGRMYVSPLSETDLGCEETKEEKETGEKC